MGIDKINNIDFPQSTTAPATTTPTLSISSAAPAFGAATITVTNHANYTNPNYSAVCTLADGTVTVTDANIDRGLESDKSHLAGTLTLADSNASTAQRTVTVKAQEFEDKKQSAGGTVTYTPSYIQNKYIRIRGVDANGSDTSDRLAIADINFYTGAGQSGTVYPTTNLTSNTSETGIVVSAGHIYSATYDAFDAVQVNTTVQMWWALSTSAANNWWQIEFEDGTYSTKPIIKSIDVYFHIQTDAAYFKITGSDNADHSSATDYGVFAISAQGEVLNFG